MARDKETSAMIDALLKFAVAGGTIGVAVLAPNAVKELDKPLKRFFDTMDERQKQRELRRLTTYMRTRGLVRGSYDHGLVVTKAGRKRAEKIAFEALSIPRPAKWDHKWRLVLFDIPESKRHARAALTAKLRLLGFQILQQSVWIHPFPCQQEIQTLAVRYDIAEWISYIETSHIDYEDRLIKRFKTTFILK